MSWHQTVESDGYARAKTILDSESAADRIDAVRALPLNETESNMLGAAAAMNGADARALLLGKSAFWLVQVGDPMAGVGVSRALKEFWRIGGEYDPASGVDRSIEYGDAVCGIAAGCLRAGDSGRALQTVSTHLSELASTPQGIRLRLIGVDAHLTRRAPGDLDLARKLMPSPAPQQPALRIEWDRLRKRLDADDGDPPESIAEQWARAIDALKQAITSMAQASGFPAALVAMLQTRLDLERKKVPTTEAELIERVSGLRDALVKGLRPRTEPQR